MPNPAHEAMQRIAAGYNGPQMYSRTDRVARSYRHDPQIETWIKWRTSDPARYAKLTAAALMSIGYYEAAKQAATDVDAGPVLPDDAA